jgi:putative mRNA 3-end processing factor
MDGLLTLNSKGLYCPKGEFYIDPWKPVKQAVVTHAHGDHLKSGSKAYYTTTTGEALMEHRIQQDTPYEMHTYDFSDSFTINGVTISFHPAGHVLGSAQVRLEYNGEVWVASGDYKRAPDPTCRPFEIQKCDVFISEATFGVPIYKWDPGHTIAGQMINWWERNASENKPTVIFAYALGKAQRILAELQQLTDKDVYIHGALDAITEIYRLQGVKMLETQLVSNQDRSKKFDRDLILSTPSGYRSAWMKRFKNCETAFASGWMRVRGRRRMQGYDRGFVLSDHADWPNLIQTIKDTGATKIYITHNHAGILARYLRETHDMDATNISTQFGDEED